MIKAPQERYPSPKIRPCLVVLQSERLSGQSLPDALRFQTIEVDHWDQVFNKLSSFRPGCLLVDFDSRREDTIAMIRHYADQGIRFSMVGITDDPSHRTLHRALRHGFIDLVPSPVDVQRLSDSIEEAFEVDSSGKDSLCELRSCFAKLTPKEREVLPSLLLGVPSRRLAGRMRVTYQTIDRHRKRVIEKMNVDNMTELAIKLYRRY